MSLSALNRSYYEQLEGLCLIVKCLFPHRIVVEKYSLLVGQGTLNTRQKELLPKLIRSIVLLNQKYRIEDKWGRFHCQKEDFINALMLLERDLPPNVRSGLLSFADHCFYTEIQEHFGAESFKARTVQELTDRSKTDVNWKLRELISKGVVEIIGGTKNRGYIFKLVEDI